MEQILKYKTKKNPGDNKTLEDKMSNIDGLSANPKKLLLKATENLDIEKQKESDKLKSGEYEWITVTPKYGKPYKKLIKKQN